VASNPSRRRLIADAGLALLGGSGSRALTHRAVDAEAGLPTGTCANYFPTKADLFLGMAERVFERLAPDPGRLTDLAELDGDDTLPAYVGYIVERLIAQPRIATALLELRLQAARSPEIAAKLGPFLRTNLDSDVAFHIGRGLPGGRDAVLLLHHVVNGILLDALTIQLDPETDPVTMARRAARRLVH
jgi:AcrR family transcriptional regulator